MNCLKTYLAFFGLASSLIVFSHDLTAQDDPIVLEYQGPGRFRGIYWEGFGLRVTWDPYIANSYIYTPLDLLDDDYVEYTTGSLSVEIIDSSILTENKDQWVQANQRPSLARQISETSRSFHANSFRNSIDNSVDGSVDAEAHLLQSKPIPIYVYGTKGTDGTESSRYGTVSYDFYEEFLVKTIYAQISYSGEPEQWFNSKLQRMRDETAEQRQNVVFALAVYSALFVLGIITFWLARHRIKAFFTG